MHPPHIPLYTQNINGGCTFPISLNPNDLQRVIFLGHHPYVYIHSLITACRKCDIEVIDFNDMRLLVAVAFQLSQELVHL